MEANPKKSPHKILEYKFHFCSVPNVSATLAPTIYHKVPPWALYEATKYVFWKHFKVLIYSIGYIYYTKMSGTNDKNILLEVIFYAGFVVMSYSSKVRKEWMES